ncbi:MAG: universal stress protein [Thermoleophilia bacterium]
MKKILVPIDGGPSARKALERAADLSKMSGDKVVVLRVVDVESYTGQFESMHDKIEDTLKKGAEEMLDAAEAIAKEHGVEVERVIRYGDASTEIMAYAKEGDCGQIIMGSAGRRGMKRAFVGSTASRVARQVGAEVLCPVTIVPMPKA